MSSDLQPGLQPMSPEALEFATKNILTSSLLNVPGRLRTEHAGCAWCDQPAVFKSKLVNPSGTFFHCRRHFAGLGIEGNPHR